MLNAESECETVTYSGRSKWAKSLKGNVKQAAKRVGKTGLNACEKNEWDWGDVGKRVKSAGTYIHALYTNEMTVRMEGN